MLTYMCRSQKMKISKKLKIERRMILERSNDIISQTCEVQDFNCTKYSPGNQVGGLPGALHTEAV